MIKTAIIHWFGRNAKPLRQDARQWRKAVLAKTGGRCVITGSTSNVQAAHLFNVARIPMLAFAVWNGVPLSADLHKRFDAWTGAARGGISTPLHWFVWRYFIRFFK
ncbi:MAG: hypothetical protein BWK73_25460 [Thiothrix lacustris]|uniref:HNH nuclease domain-containing protein n=1 Tax=Thiothrix lacustris TaxID=525917 RepID=A0A1Y1QL93_9GAMM|nr:MAG: hypothetical protein BWK73_25460 [Thiothrix lacustris]